MRKAAVLALILAGGLVTLSSCTIWREPRVHTWRTATGGRHYEELVWQEVKAGNWRQIEMRLSATFVSLSPTGTRDREAFLRDLRQVRIADYRISDLEVRPAGNDMVVTYTVELRGSYAGRPLPAEPLRMMTVWQQVGRAWIAVAHSVVPAREGAPANRPPSE